MQAQWKAGKRRAEKDELIAGAFLTTIELPNVTVDVGAKWVCSVALVSVNPASVD